MLKEKHKGTNKNGERQSTIMIEDKLHMKKIEVKATVQIRGTSPRSGSKPIRCENMQIKMRKIPKRP